MPSRNLKVFSKSYCPYCKKIKELFLLEKMPHKVVELDIKGKLNAADGRERSQDA